MVVRRSAAATLQRLHDFFFPTTVVDSAPDARARESPPPEHLEQNLRLLLKTLNGPRRNDIVTHWNASEFKANLQRWLGVARPTVRLDRHRRNTPNSPHHLATLCVAEWFALSHDAAAAALFGDGIVGEGATGDELACERAQWLLCEAGGDQNRPPTARSDSAVHHQSLEVEDHRASIDSDNRQDDLVLTETARTTLSKLQIAVRTGRPVLLTGEAGCGKSFYLEKLAQQRLCGGENAEITNLFFDEMTDAKSLLGFYQCGESAGDFQWKAGVLTRAVLDGHWLVLEDVDGCPEEVLAALRSLVRERTLLVNGKIVVAHEGFR